MSTEVANLAKQAVGATADLTLMAKKKQSERSNPRRNEECFNCGKKSYYAKNCRDSTSNKRRLEKSIKEVKRAR